MALCSRQLFELKLIDSSNEKLRRSGFQYEKEWMSGFEPNIWSEAQKFDYNSC